MRSIKTSNNYALTFLTNNFMSLSLKKYGENIRQKCQRGAIEKFNVVHTHTE